MLRVILLLTLATFAMHSKADTLNQASQKMCEKMKVCMKQQMAKEDINPEMRDMLDNMVDHMCQEILDVTTVLGQQELEQPAIACLNSMTSLSCEELDNSKSTPECIKFESLISK